MKPYPIQHAGCDHVRNVIGACLMTAALLLSGCRRAAPPAEQPSTEQLVSITSPVSRELSRFIRVTGTLYGDEEATIAAKVAGRVVEVLKDLGDTAASSEALIRIDPTDYELARAERETALAETLSKLGLIELPGPEFSVDSVPSVARARLQTENALARLERARQLYERDPPLISEQDFADLQTTHEVAQSNMNVERLTAEAILAEARTVKAQVDVAQQRVIDAVHRAPVMTNSPDRTYEVAARMVTVGDYVQIGAPLMRLVDSGLLKLRASVPERRLGVVQIGQSVTVQIEAFKDQFTGRVSRVSPSVDMTTRSFIVEIIIANDDHRLKPGSFSTAHIEIGKEPALLVPESSLITFAGVHKVVRVVDGKALQQRVELGERIDGMVEIRGGLTADQPIVARPPATLRDGTPLRVATDADQLQTVSQTSKPPGVQP